MILEPKVGPYMGVVADEKKTFKVGKQKRTFRVLAYTAYNAMGLIGTESHGIAVLDEDRMAVVSDEIGRGEVDYPALDPRKVVSLHAEVMRAPWPVFQSLVNTSGRCRYRI